MTARPVHPATPRKLARAYRRERTFHRLEAALGVNARYLWEMIVRGIEPKNPDVRVKMFLPRHPRRKHQPKQPRPMDEALKWWRRLDKDRRKEIVRQLYNALFNFTKEY